MCYQSVSNAMHTVCAITDLTKIYATIGPHTQSVLFLKELLKVSVGQRLAWKSRVCTTAFQRWWTGGARGLVRHSQQLKVVRRARIWSLACMIAPNILVLKAKIWREWSTAVRARGCDPYWHIGRLVYCECMRRGIVQYDLVRSVQDRPPLMLWTGERDQCFVGRRGLTFVEHVASQETSPLIWGYQPLVTSKSARRCRGRTCS